MKKISLSLLATTILSTTALQAYAAAPKEPEIYFYPSKSWIVGKASEDSKQCAVQSEFNNGFVLQFDGSDQWVESLSVNFRQSIFNEGQNYNITLGAPGKTTKGFSATATSNTTLTIPLRDEKEIYQAAREGAVMDVTIDENNFRFYLVNFAPAAKNFETCMAGGQIEQPQQQSAEAPAPVLEAAPAPVSMTDAEQPSSSVIQPAQPLETAATIPVQGEIAPPPPNSEPETIVTLNESIEMENNINNAGNVPVTEIVAENPQPTVQKIPYTETVKIGDEVITKEKSADEMNSSALKERVPAQVAATQAAPSPAAAPAGEKPQYRKRMSELLAEEMSQNPSMARIDEPAKSDSVSAAAVTPVKQDDLAPPQEQLKAVEPTIEEKPQEKIAVAEPAPAPVADEPFSKAGEKIDTDIPASMRPDYPQPVEAPAPQVENIKTPEVIVHKETRKMEADFTGFDQVEPASDQNSHEPFARKADPDMLRKISELEHQITNLEKENVALNDELKSSVEGSKQEVQSIASENWNLERATMKYNEAERQIKRLGEQIAKERAMHQSEKKELEAQLFDPRITDQQQLARLAELERKLEAAEQQLAAQRGQYRGPQAVQ